MKTALITGATSGIGLSIAKGLLNLGWCVLMTGRTDAALHKAHAALPQAVRAHAHLFQADLSRKDETMRAAGEINHYLQTRHNGRLDLLIANAVTVSGRITADGLNESLAVQCLSPLWLLDALKDALSRSPKGHIIFTGSMAHRLTPGHHYQTWFTSRHALLSYCRAKLGVNWLALALCQELPNLRIDVADPGFVHSRLGSKSTAQWLRICWPVISRYGITPAKASGTFILLSQCEDLPPVRYWNDREPSDVSHPAKDAALADAFIKHLRSL